MPSKDCVDKIEVKCQICSIKWQATVRYSKRDTIHCRSCIARRLATTHGGKGTKIYMAWQSIKRRCYNPSIHNYSNYGGKGIRVSLYG